MSDHPVLKGNSMTKLTLNSKEFKSIMKTMDQFASQSFGSPPLTIAVQNGNLRFALTTDHCHVMLTPSDAVLEGDEADYTFYLEKLSKLPFSSKTITLEWEESDGPVNITGGRLRTTLRAGTNKPDWNQLTDEVAKQTPVKIPTGLLAGFIKYLKIPFSFFKMDKVNAPIRIMTDNDGKLVAVADDGFSVAKVESNLKLEGELDIVLPRFVLEAMFGKDKIDVDDEVQLKSYGYEFQLNGKSMTVSMSSLNDDVNDMNYEGDFTAGCTFDPKLLSAELKPMVAIVPTKDRSGTVISLNMTDKMSLAVKHRDGEGVIDEVEGVSEIKPLESGLSMHPQAFLDYTGLFDLESGEMKLNEDAVLYQGESEAGGVPIVVKYLFPTVRG